MSLLCLSQISSADLSLFALKSIGYGFCLKSLVAQIWGKGFTDDPSIFFWKSVYRFFTFFVVLNTKRMKVGKYEYSKPLNIYFSLNIYLIEIEEKERYFYYLLLLLLTLPVPFISESCIKMNINVNFYFYTSLWCLKRFYEGLWGTTKNCENKFLS